MLDLKWVKKHFTETKKKLKVKDKEVDIGLAINLEEKVRELKAQLESLQAKKNALSKQIGNKKRAGGDLHEILELVSKIGGEISDLEKKISPEKKKLKEILAKLPNIPDKEVPLKEDPSFNKCIKNHLEKPSFSFPPKNHLELGEKLGLFDFKRSVKLAGSGFAIYTKKGALLEWALLNLMWKIQIKHGFIPQMVPHLAKPESLYAVGQLPKFSDQIFQIHDKDHHLYLLPTAEVALCGMHMDEIIPEKQLPLKYFAYTPCFRREAGAAGCQDRGLIRTHQFNKVEMFAFTKPQESDQLFQQMIASAEEVLKTLNLHYRSMLLAAGDMPFAAAKTIDIELWLPGQDRYYECSSISNCRDFQARRAKIRYRAEDGKTQFAHTLNGSGLATSRLMVALLENNQCENGEVRLPEALHEVMNGEKLAI